VLYVGGGARIKGFNNMISALPKLLKRPGIRLICLGNYSKYEKITLDRIKKRAKGGSHLIVVGYVPDIRPYLRGTKLLLLPIEAPHFCRPAIEAGFFKKTFIVPSFNGLKDFVVHGNNCLTYDRDNSHNFIEVVSDLLDNQAKRNELEKMNWRMSQNFYKNSKQIKILMSYIFKSRYHLMKK
jgi:glycosyltransferase involved in cell wall biosynthesis